MARDVSKRLKEWVLLVLASVHPPRVSHDGRGARDEGERDRHVVDARGFVRGRGRVGRASQRPTNLLYLARHDRFLTGACFCAPLRARTRCSWSTIPTARPDAKITAVGTRPCDGALPSRRSRLSLCSNSDAADIFFFDIVMVKIGRWRRRRWTRCGAFRRRTNLRPPRSSRSRLPWR